MSTLIRELASVCKLRIGFAIMLTGLAGLAVTPGELPASWEILLFCFAILLSSASAGAYNQYAERDLDARMQRTRNRPFVTGKYKADGVWLFAISLMLVVPVALSAWFLNFVAALFVFLGAFTYGVIYTVWLKRRTWLNIVIGGLAGSFAVLGGAAVVDPGLSAEPVLLALVLFLWTPPHFWSLAFIFASDYREADVPMLPTVFTRSTATRIIFAHTFVLVIVSVLPFFFGLGWIYLTGALFGGLFFLYTSYKLLRSPSLHNARINFRASLLQLTPLLLACGLDAFFN
ncbi:MAG: protoheme IX farnesyltransferase [Gammaproteobacteria bacterium]|nr:protoheme IX farnesyltransferase [Gammaproteobacteria bacterium]